MRYETKARKPPLEQLRRKLAHADQGWFFAQIAEQLAARRAELGLSQQQLAELCGTTQSAIARLESGGRPPRLRRALASGWAGGWARPQGPPPPGAGGTGRGAGPPGRGGGPPRPRPPRGGAPRALSRPPPRRAPRGGRPRRSRSARSTGRA